ncbi:unnamed protein product [Gemmataceae bacterium]|nr:unnamed protein product [Gemmataceae bacterium]VTU01223.1 unnamed protein product [Gemmataceae bacterium]
MRTVPFAGLFGALLALAAAHHAPARAQAPKDAPKLVVKDTPAAEFTRTKALKVKVTAEFTEVKLGEILKEFAHLAEEKTDEPLMLAYGEGFPFAKKVTFKATNVTLEAALDALLKKAGGTLGYVVVSKDGDKYDGWVRLTATGERGVETPPPGAAEEAEAAARLGLAKKLIDAKKPASAKPVLEIVARTYPGTRAGAEAKALLEKLVKEMEKE